MERFCLRNTMTSSRTWSTLGAACGPLAGGKKNSRCGLVLNSWQRTRKLPAVYPKRFAASSEERSSTKKARNASYCRWVALEGSRKAFVSSFTILIDICPLCQINNKSQYQNYQGVLTE